MKFKFNIKLFAIIISLVSLYLLSIGYAAFSQSLRISGEAKVRISSNHRVTNFEINNLTSDASEKYNSEYDKTSVTFDVLLPNLDSEATYDVTYTNFTSDSIKLTSVSFVSNSNPNVVYELVGNSIGTIIEPNGKLDFKVVLKYNDSLTELPTNTEINDSIVFSYDVLTTYTISYNGFDSTGLPTTVIQGDSVDLNINYEPEDLIIYMNGGLLTKNNGYTYSNGVYHIDSATGNINIGYEVDTYAPVISNLTYVVNDDSTVTLNWEGTDRNGISKFYIVVSQVTDGTETVLSTNNVSGSTFTYTVSSLDDGTYTFKVYGKDTLDNVPSSESISDAPTDYVAKVQAVVNNVFDVTYVLTNITSSGDSTVRKNDNYTTTLTAATNYILPDSIEVKIDGTVVSTSKYTYNNSTGVLTITKPNGEVTITATGLKNLFTITKNVTNGSISGSSSVNRNATFSGTLSANTNYCIPDSIQVSDSSSNLSTSDYTYNSSTGAISIPNIVDNITITASPYKCVFTVTNSLSKCSSNGSSTANINQTYSATISASSNYNLPSSITVTMGGTTLSSSDYTWSRSSGSLKIPNVTGDIEISITATRSTCLVEGTRISTKDGYKNIEDINYFDLLKVWNYETGSVTYEYPIWIEKEGTQYEYQQNTFSDGTVLNTVGYHGIFSYDKNEFISVDNPNDFKVGTSVAIVKNNKLQKVKVTNIKYINKKVKYYHVVSTRYYNIIANDLITTDGTTVLSNLYGFNSNITWKKDRLKLMKNNTYSYNEFKDIMPYYMFKGLRAEEGKIIENVLPKDVFISYLLKNQLNNEMLREPIKDFNGNNLWNVTINNKSKIYKEGSYITLPKSNKTNFICYLNTSDNKCYYPGDKVKVDYGMYFETILKDTK